MLIRGDARHIPLKSNTVQCVISSPPYWGLRDYGTARWEGGAPDCDHKKPGANKVFGNPVFNENRPSREQTDTPGFRDKCGKCGARRIDSQIGLEPTPEAYVAEIVAVFREIWRVLRKDGVCFLNLGDSYASHDPGGYRPGEFLNPDGKPPVKVGNHRNRAGNYKPFGLKPKDLVGIPWRVAFALQAPYYAGRIKNEGDRKWLAALTDGEGCITILRTTSPHGSGDSFPPVYQIRMCDLEPIQKAFQLTGYGKASPRQDPPSYGGNNGSYQWRLVGRKAVDIVAEVYPYLLTKRKQAIIVWNHQQIRESYETKRGVRIPREAFQKQEFCRDLIKRVIKREVVDIPSWMEEPKYPVQPGWYLRSDCIWSKPNPMPESVTDRPTKSHEYVFLLTKSERYYYDQESVREEAEYGRCGWDSQQFKGGDITRHHGGPGNHRRGCDPSAGRNRRSVWEVASEAFSGAHFACVDEQTECLTIDGWKKHNEIKPNDIIGSLNMESNKCLWSPALDIYRYIVSNQEMIGIHGRTLDMLLTPNHRCVIYRQSNRRPELELMPPDIIRADELKQSHRLSVSSEWHTIMDEIKIDNNLAALIGWYLAEGSEGDNIVLLYQSGDANPEYVQEIRDLLRKVGADFTETERTRIYRSRPVIAVTWRITGAVANELLALCPGKSFPQNVLLWNESALSHLWDALIKGDGHFRDANRMTFVQKRKDILNTVQAIAFRLGYSTVSRKRSEGTWSLYKTDYRYRLLRSETTDLITAPRYSGIVWCPTTQYGTFVARRNGRVFITGNTFPRKLIEPMILAGSRPGDVVFDPFCGTGTTQLVAKELSRIGIGLDLKYQELAAERITGGPLLAGLVNAEPLDLAHTSRVIKK